MKRKTKEQLPTSKVESGEAWCSVIGAPAVLSKTVNEISDSDAKKVASIDGLIITRAKSLIRGTIVNPPLKLIDYQKVLEQTSEGIDEGHIERMIKAIPRVDQLPYMTAARRVFDSLQKQLPHSVYQTVSGSQALEPDDLSMLKYSELYAALDDPIAFSFGGMSDGSIDHDIVVSIKGVYPSIFESITGAIQDELEARVMKNKNFMLPDSVEVGVSAWLGIPIEVPLPQPTQKPQMDDAGNAGADDKSELDDSLSPSDKIAKG